MASTLKVPIRWWEPSLNEYRQQSTLILSYFLRKSVSPYLETLPFDTCIGRVVRSGMSWEKWLVTYFVKYADANSTSIDVGANIGAHTVALAGLSKTVYAFEPQRVVFSVLQNNTKFLNNVHLINAAASNSENVAYMDQSSTNVGAARISKKGGGEQINTVRIDDISFTSPVKLIKIDAEKHEEEVLLGALETIKRDHPVIILEDLCNARSLLKQLGYATHRLSLHDFLCLPPMLKAV